MKRLRRFHLDMIARKIAAIGGPFHIAMCREWNGDIQLDFEVRDTLETLKCEITIRIWGNNKFSIEIENLEVVSRITFEAVTASNEFPQTEIDNLFNYLFSHINSCFEAELKRL